LRQETVDLLTRTKLKTNAVLSRHAGLDWSQVDRVLMVGGATRMPMVREMLQSVTGKVPDDTIDPDQVVAKGAAVYANILAAQRDDCELSLDNTAADQLRDVTVQDVSARSYGVKVKKRQDGQEYEAYRIMVPKNTPLPYAASAVYTLLKRGRATNLRVQVLEGEVEEDPGANNLLGECRVSGLPPELPTGSPVQVRLSCETNGRVRAMALDMSTGRFGHAVIRIEAGLTEAELAREIELVNQLVIT
jgi:molecular chaperone DnaK